MSVYCPPAQANDTRSLTLNKVKTKIRAKKPRKPDALATLYLFNVIFDSGLSIQALLIHHYPTGIIDAALAACWWKGYLARRANDSFAALTWIMRVMAICLLWMLISICGLIG